MSNRKNFSNAHNDGFSDINDGFANNNDDFADINDRFADINDRFADINDKFADINDKFADINDRFADINRDFAHNNNNAPHNGAGFSSDKLAHDIGVIGGGAPYPDMPPLQFVRETLGDKPYDKQEEILRAVEQAANASDGRRRVSVVGCNGSGKDWVAARVILWWMNTRDPAKVVITGPTTRQVTDIVWRELRAAYKNSDKPLRGTVRRAVLYEIDDESLRQRLRI